MLYTYYFVTVFNFVNWTLRSDFMTLFLQKGLLDIYFSTNIFPSHGNFPLERWEVGKFEPCKVLYHFVTPFGHGWSPLVKWVLRMSRS